MFLLRLLLLLFAVQALADASKKPSHESTKYGAKKKAATLDQFSEIPSSGRTTSTGRKQAVKRGLAPVTIPNKAPTSTAPKGCTVTTLAELKRCKDEPWVVGNKDTLFDLSSTTEDDIKDWLLNKQKIESISIRLDDSRITNLIFGKLTSWTTGERDTVIANNINLIFISFPLLSAFRGKADFIISKNPLLEKLQFLQIPKDGLSTKKLYITKNPRLEAVEITLQKAVPAVIRGNKNMAETGGPFLVDSDVQTTPECGFWDPISDFKDLDGCTAIWDDVSFATNITGTPPSSIISRIEGNLKLIGTDLKSLDFLAKDIVITGAVDFKDNNDLPCDTTLAFNDNTGTPHKILGWPCPTTTSTTTTSTKSTTTKLTTTTPTTTKPTTTTPTITTAAAPTETSTTAGSGAGFPVAGDSAQVSSGESGAAQNKENLGGYPGPIAVWCVLGVFFLGGCGALGFGTWKIRKLKKAKALGKNDNKAAVKVASGMAHLEKINQLDKAVARAKVLLTKYNPPIGRHHLPRQKPRPRPARRFGWPFTKRSSHECFKQRHLKVYPYLKQLCRNFSKRLRWGRLYNHERRWVVDRSRTLKQIPRDECLRWHVATSDPLARAIRSTTIPRLDRLMPKVTKYSNGKYKYCPATYFGRRKKFIMASAPLPNELHDFWSLVEKEKVKAIVCIGNKFSEGTKARRGVFGLPTYWPHSKRQPTKVIHGELQWDPEDRKKHINTDIVVRCKASDFLYPDKKRHFCRIRLHTLGSRRVNFRKCVRYRKGKCMKCSRKHDMWLRSVQKEGKPVKLKKNYALYRDFNYKRTIRRRGRRTPATYHTQPNPMFTRASYLKVWRRGAYLTEEQIQKRREATKARLQKRSKCLGKEGKRTRRTRRRPEEDVQPPVAKTKTPRPPAVKKAKVVEVKSPAVKKDKKDKKDKKRTAGGADKRRDAPLPTVPSMSHARALMREHKKKSRYWRRELIKSDPLIRLELRNERKKARRAAIAALPKKKKLVSKRTTPFKAKRKTPMKKQPKPMRKKKDGGLAAKLKKLDGLRKRKWLKEHYMAKLNGPKRYRPRRTFKPQVVVTAEDKAIKRLHLLERRKTRKQKEKQRRSHKKIKRSNKRKTEKKKRKQVKAFRKVVHFHVQNWGAGDLPNIQRLVNLAILVNKLKGRVLVHSQSGLDRAPTFCIVAMLIDRLRSGEPIPDVWALCKLMRHLLPQSLNHDHTIHTIFMALIYYMRRYRDHFPVPRKLWKGMKIYYRRAYHRYSSANLAPLRQMLDVDRLERAECKAAEDMVSPDIKGQDRKDEIVEKMPKRGPNRRFAKRRQPAEHRYEEVKEIVKKASQYCQLVGDTRRKYNRSCARRRLRLAVKRGRHLDRVLLLKSKKLIYKKARASSAFFDAQQEGNFAKLVKDMGDKLQLETYFDSMAKHIYSRTRPAIGWLQTTSLKRNYWKGTRVCRQNKSPEDYLEKAQYKFQKMTTGRFQPRYLTKGRRTTGLKRTGRGVRRALITKNQKKVMAAPVLKKRQKRLQKTGGGRSQPLKIRPWLWTRLMRKRRLVKKFKGQPRRNTVDETPLEDTPDLPMKVDRRHLHKGKKGKKVMILKARVNRRTRHKRRETVVTEVKKDESKVAAKKKSTRGSKKSTKAAQKKKKP